jgi:fructose 5-dehydrogenase cytochrome subunit
MMASTQAMKRGRYGRMLSTVSLTLVLCGLQSLALAQTTNPDQTALLEQGRYLAIAGDCAACHTKPGGGEPFAGGYDIMSPFGAIVATNITPSKVAGIGGYTEAQFASALRQGIRADGAHLYPAMPYTSYSRMTDADVHALYAFFMNGVAPVDETPPQTKLPFPFNVRLLMIGWNMLFLDDRRFTPDASKSADWNRGAYLTDVMEHCNACHTPRNLLMAESNDKAYAGGPVGTWYAPNITSDPVSGVGGWSNAEVIQYLKTGIAHGKGQAAGGMAEAVQNSLQFLTQDDLAAIAVYLKSVPPIRNPGETKPAYAHGQPANFEPELRGKAKQTSGSPIVSSEALFSGYCASCHQPTGGGTPNQSYPALFHNTATGGINADNMVSAILFGVDRMVGDRHAFMPRFDDSSFVQSLSDEQIAKISTFVAQEFGNPRLNVTAADVATIRAGGPTSPLALVSTYAVPALVVVAVAIIALVALLLIRRQRHRPGNQLQVN